MAEVREKALECRPKLIVAGYTAYTRTLDFCAFREIADEVGAYFMVDMSHFAGLVAGNVLSSPVLLADIVTTTTHKTLRGPRGAIIMCREEDRIAGGSLKKKVDSAVFPGMQGGPLDNVIAAKAVCFKEAMEPSFCDYQHRVVDNAKALASFMDYEKVRLISGGTDNHMVLLDASKSGFTGKEAEKRLESIGISVNRNLVPFDTRSSLDPSGLRVGTPSVTTRGLSPIEIAIVAKAFNSALDKKCSEEELNKQKEIIKWLSIGFPVYRK
jgi:glycine hydroxymethyltransferase